MVTLTLEPRADSGSVLITVTGAADDDVLMRTDRNGTAPVRTFPNQGVEAGGLIITDYEPALFGAIRYEIGGASALTYLDGTRAPFALVPVDLIITPVFPSNRATPTLTVEHTYQRPSNATRHDVIGRPDQLAVLAPLGFRTGTLRFIVPDADAANALEAVYDKGEIVLVRFASGAHAFTGRRFPNSRDVYHIADRVDVAPAEFGYYAVTVSYVELRRPSAPLAGSFGWTFDDVTAQFESFDEVRAAFATFNDLKVGP
jgi:hypothetical protein